MHFLSQARSTAFYLKDIAKIFLKFAAVITYLLMNHIALGTVLQITHLLNVPVNAAVNLCNTATTLY